MSRETARKVSSFSSRVWYNESMVGKRRGAAVEQVLALVCPGVAGGGCC